MNLFTDLYNSSVEILNISYISYLSISKKINLQKFIGCLSSIFNIISPDLKDGIVLRFKRVANYNEYDSQEAFIIELINLGNNENEIITQLVQNFGLTNEEAQKKFIDLFSSLQVFQNLHPNRRIKIKNNPGFLTTIKRDNFTQNILIQVNNINDIFYLDTIPIYLDSLIRITQNIQSSPALEAEINTLCKKTKVKEDTKIKDIVAISEKVFP